MLRSVEEIKQPLDKHVQAGKSDLRTVNDLATRYRQKRSVTLSVERLGKLWMLSNDSLGVVETGETYKEALDSMVETIDHRITRYQEEPETMSDRLVSIVKECKVIFDF